MEKYPKSIQLQIIAGGLNSYHHIRMTDCEIIFDFHMKSQDSIKKTLIYIEDSKDLYNLYFLLNENGIKNLVRLFPDILNAIELKHITTVGLNIHDFNFTKNLYTRIVEW